MLGELVGYGYCCSCNCNACCERLFAKTTNCVKRALIRTSRKTRVYFTKTPESLFNVNGVGVSQSSLPILEVKKDESNPVSLASIFQVVADDLLTLNNNLQTKTQF